MLIKKNSSIKMDQKTLLPSYLKEIELSKVNIKDKNILNLDSKIKKGFRGYEPLLFLENVSSNSIENLKNEFKKLIEGLEKDRIYSILVTCISENDYKRESHSILPNAIFIHYHSSIIELAYLILKRLIIYESKYESTESYGLVISGRVWYTKEELNSLNLREKEKDEDMFEKVCKKTDENLIETNKDRIEWFLNNTIKSISNKGLHLKLTPIIINNLNIINGDFTFTLYSLNKLNFNSESLLLCFNHYDKNIYYLMENGNTLLEWIDYVKEDKIVRKFDEMSITFKKIETDNNLKVVDNIKESKTERGLENFKVRKSVKSEIDHIELKYNFKRLVETSKTHLKDLTLGAIDLETYSVDSLGTQEVYAGGWSANGEISTYYLGYEGVDNSIKLIQTLFNDIFKSDYSKYTFYVHNLSNFDSIFIIDALTRNNYMVNPTIKEDGSLISLNITKNISLLNDRNEKRTIKIYDSALMLNGSLRSLAKEFSCDMLKGHFPHKFISCNTLTYNGTVPDYKFFTDISENEYKELYLSPKSGVSGFNNKNYSIKQECLKYLKADILTLNELMLKFANIIFEEFGLNITKFKTISGLSLHIYLSNFYKLGYNVTTVKGNIEKEIRKSYFGGLVTMEKGFTIDKGYFYDVNSQYPSVMLKPMPVGNPILSTDTNLDNYFGFCYVKVIPPKNLRNYLIPYREESGKVVCPSTPFSGIYFSELLKGCLSYGYQIQVMGGIKFKKGIGIFDSFVKSLYEKRLEAKASGNNSFQKVLKLVLNSLYGRMGMRGIENKIEIVNKDKAESLLQRKNILKITELNDKVLIKYNNNINNDILKLIDSNTLSIFNNNTKINTLAGLNKERGIPTSVPIASAITAYAQLEMMKFKNIPDNKLLYSDTDSLLMEHPLPEKYVHSTRLGMLKLENVITEGYFISPKFYSFINSEGKIIIKTKGVARDKLKFEDFKSLANGKDLTVKSTIFSKNLEKCIVKISEIDYTIKGIKD